MRRLLPILAFLLLAARGPAQQPPQPFSFIHITDTHLTATANVEPLTQLVSRVNAMQPKPAFVVDTGDVTEAGRPEEFDRFLQAVQGLTVPFYCAPGNHDVRWGPLGKEAFTNAFKKLYQSFDVGGCHFVVLDSTVLLEHWGHFDTTELKWLENDLKKLKKGTPVFLFLHHWIGREGVQIDNEDALLRRIGPYNVLAIFVGHGHSDLQWKVNGIPCYMARGLYQGTYDQVDVGPSEVQVFRVRAEDGWKPTLLSTLSRAATPRRRIAFGWDDENIPVLARRHILAELRSGDEPIKESVKADYSVDGTALQPMEPDLRKYPGERSVRAGRFVATFATKGLADGAHLVSIRMTAPDGEMFRRQESFEVERVEGAPKQSWAFETGDVVQSSAAIAGDTVYATSFDGKVYAFAAADGRRRWATATKGPIYASPLVSGDAVYVGSMDHFLYALDAKSGHIRWKFDSGSPIFATAAESAGVVCFGGNRKIYGLDSANGQPRWTQEAGGFFQSHAAAADGVFYLGGWDNTLYALDAATGQPRWKAQMGRTNGGRGQLSFYFSPAIASPTVGGGHVFVCTNDGLLHSVSVQTGKDDWAVRAPRGGDVFGYSSPLYLDGRVYVGGLGEGGRGDCYAIDAKNGDLVWRCSTGADNYDSGPAPVRGLVAIGSVQGKVSWIDARSGKLVHQYALDPGFCFSTPTSNGKLTYIPSMNNTLYALSVP